MEVLQTVLHPRHLTVEIRNDCIEKDDGLTSPTQLP